MRTKLRVTWGNNSWVKDAIGRIRPHKRLTKGHPKWINYRKPPIKDTCDLRVAGHPDSEYRCKFTDQILEEMLSTHRESKSEQPICFITCGGTASGKTSAVQKYLDNKNDHLKYIRIDYDALKRCLPEYSHMVDLGIKEAASFVHVESAKMAGKLFKKALAEKMNIIFEKTLAETAQTQEEIKKLRKKGYLIVLIAAHVKVSIGQERAVLRYKQGGRFIDPGIIADTYQKVHKSVHLLKDEVDSLALFDNNDKALKLILYKEGATVKIVDSALYEEYLNTVTQDYRLD
nr:zeta toxin family protein [uncultured Bdellovibrio sp.]